MVFGRAGPTIQPAAPPVVVPPQYDIGPVTTAPLEHHKANHVMGLVQKLCPATQQLVLVSQSFYIDRKKEQQKSSCAFRMVAHLYIDPIPTENIYDWFNTYVCTFYIVLCLQYLNIFAHFVSLI